MKKEGMVVLLSLMLVFSSVSCSLALSEQYDLIYDDNGNVVSGFGFNHSYNNFNQLVNSTDSVSGEIIAQYFYDSRGNRIKKVEFHSDGSNTTTYYIGTNFVHVVNSSGVFNETYYNDGKDLVARKDNEGNVFYYHPDHLGSTSIITNDTGDVVEETSYLPFGDVIDGGDSRYSYTGKEKDKDTSLMYYGARYYDPFLRHFVQPDPVISDIYNPQDLNRYTYVRNNPYKYVDPSGNAALQIGGSGSIAGGIFKGFGPYVSIGYGVVIAHDSSKGLFDVKSWDIGLYETETKGVGLGLDISGTLDIAYTKEADKVFDLTDKESRQLGFSLTPEYSFGADLNFEETEEGFSDSYKLKTPTVHLGGLGLGAEAHGGNTETVALSFFPERNIIPETQSMTIIPQTIITSTYFLDDSNEKKKDNVNPEVKGK